MIGLIITGGSPAICRELAGHADIDVSSHYYSNISNLVECATIERLRKIKGGDGPAIVGERKYPISKPESSFRVTNGFCGSEAFRDRNVSECLKAVGADGQIGDCGACPHFRPDRQGPMLEFGDGATAKAAVDADSRYLMQMTELVRKGMGCAEDIGTALLRLQHSSNRYSICIQEEFKNGETKKTE
jgi:hypothetical protein